MVVDDRVVVVDAGCAGIVTGDVAMLGGLGGPVTRAVGSDSVWAVSSVGFVVVWILESTQSAAGVFFSELGLSSSSGSV